MARLNRLALVLPVLLLAACSSDRTLADRLGLGRNVPDEFQVVERAPLTLPPEFGLRPPAPGAPRPQEGTTSQQAQQALLGAPLAAADATPGQDALLARAGADAADPNIRTVIVEERAGLTGVDEDRFWFILDFQRRAFSRADGSELDARAEAQRLAEAGINVRSSRIGGQPIVQGGGG